MGIIEKYRVDVVFFQLQNKSKKWWGSYMESTAILPLLTRVNSRMCSFRSMFPTLILTRKRMSF